MIYSYVINEMRMEDLFKSPEEIIKEYYENEIDFLKHVITYKDSINEATINESSVEAIHEEFINKAITKVKEILRKFKEWLIQTIKTIAHNISEFVKNEKHKMDICKQNIQRIMKDNTKSKEEKFKEILNEIAKIKKVKRNKDSDKTVEVAMSKIEYKYYKAENMVNGVNYIFKAYEKIDSYFFSLSSESKSDEISEYFKNLKHGEILKDAMAEAKKNPVISSVKNEKDLEKCGTDTHYVEGIEKVEGIIEKRVAEIKSKISKLEGMVDKQDKIDASLINTAVHALEVEMSNSYKYLAYLKKDDDFKGIFDIMYVYG